MKNDAVGAAPKSDRAALADQLGRLPVGSLVTVTAGAGYGKSTLLSEWLPRSPVPAVVIRLDERHNERDELGRFIIARLRSVAPQLASLTASSAAPDWIRELLPKLMSALTGKPVIPLFDDVQMLTDPAAIQLLATFLDQHLRSGVAVLAGRRLPDLGPLTGAKSTVKITGRHLRLRPEDVRALSPDKLSPRVAEQLAHSTWGWPAGVRMALGRHGRGEINGFGHSHDIDDWVRNYFEYEVVESLTPGQLQVLTTYAVAGPIDSDGLQRLLPDIAVDSILAEVAREEPPLISVSASRTTPLALHDLVREELDARLRRTDQGRRRQLLTQASEHFLSLGQDRDAFIRLLRLDDRRLLAEFVAERGYHLTLQGQTGPVRRWLDAFSVSELLQTPKLIFVRALIAASDCDTASLQHWLGLYLRSRPADSPTASSIAEQGDDPEVMAAALTEIAGVEPVGLGVDGARRSSGPFGALAQILAAVALGTAGYFDLCISLLDDCQDAVDGYPLLEIQHWSTRATAYARLGRISEGIAATARARQICTDHGLGDSLLAITVDTQEAWYRARLGQSAEAHEALIRGRQKAADLTAGMRLARLAWLTCLAEAAMMLGDSATAAILAGEAEALLEHEPNATAVGAELAQLRARLAESKPEPSARPALTTSELGVLRYLGSFLSVPRIAQEVGVSAATVRAHTQNIYRKLGVHRRSDAVAKAFELGILATPSQERSSPDF